MAMESAKGGLTRVHATEVANRDRRNGIGHKWPFPRLMADRNKLTMRQSAPGLTGIFTVNGTPKAPCRPWRTYAPSQGRSEPAAEPQMPRVRIGRAKPCRDRSST